MSAILRMFRGERVLWLDRFTDAEKQQAHRLWDKGYVERVYAPNGREGIRLTAAGRRRFEEIR